MKPCVFCQIARGEAAAEIVWTDDHALAFLDNRPLFPGHVLLIPRTHVETLADLPPGQIAPLFHAAQRLEKAVEQAMKAEGSFIAVNNKVSQSVPHLHVHVVPRNKGDGLKGFFWPRKGYENEDHLRSTAEAIRRSLDLEDTLID